MEKVNSIYLSRLSNADHYNFMFKISLHVEGSHAIKRFEKEAAAIRQAYDAEATALFAEKKSRHVMKRNKFDDIQYDNAMSMKAILKAYSRTSLEEEADAAERLLKLFEKNPFDDKSSSSLRILNICIICSYLEREQSALKLLGLSKLYTALMEANTKCEKEQKTIRLEQENRRDRSVANTRAASDKAYKAYVEAVEIFAYTEKDPALLQEIKNINNIIKHFNSERTRIAAIRAAFAKKKEGEAEE